MIQLRLRPFAFVAGLAFALAGCDSQAGPDYQGDPLATLRGSVVSQSAAPASGDAVLIWENPATSPDQVIGVSVPVSGSFPASFTMPIYAPPPPAAIIYAPDETGDDRVAVGVVGMLKAGADPSKLDEQDDNLLGICEDHVVVYIQNEISAGSYWERILGGRPAIGYHLMEVVRKTPAEKDAIRACDEAYGDAVNACYDECGASADGDEACYDACDASIPRPECGSGHDTFREAAAGFGTTITVSTSLSHGIDWY